MGSNIPPFTANADGTWQFGNQRLHQCQCCCIIGINIRYVPGFTNYPWDGKGKDPNEHLLCPECELEQADIMRCWAMDYYSY